MEPPLYNRDKGTVKQWTSRGERAPKKVKMVLSVGKVMAQFFGMHAV